MENHEDTKSTASASLSSKHVAAKKLYIKKEDIKCEIDDALEFKPIKSELAPISEGFSHTFDIPTFSMDEIKFRLDGRTIYVECERKVSALGVTGGKLVYSMKIPVSVDISTIQSTWTGEELEVTAQMNV